MSARYGDRTRSGDAVSGVGRRAEAGVAWSMTEEVFTSPGTWTCPSTVTQVEVIVVGGGGGGGASNSPPNQCGGGGGGGGVRTAILPVSGPVPITIGAGGRGGGYAPSPAFPPLASSPFPSLPGGTSAFGSLGPGPVPAIPPTTIAAGGGGGGASYLPTESSLPTVEPIGGGGGGIGDAFYPGPNTTGTAGGRYGYRSASSTVTSPSRIYTIGAGGAGDSNIGRHGGRGKLGFGFGAPSTNSTVPLVPPTFGGSPSRTGPAAVGGAIAATAGANNTGNGGGAGFAVGGVPAPLAPLLNPGAAGGSGVVIVRYWS